MTQKSLSGNDEPAISAEIGASTTYLLKRTEIQLVKEIPFLKWFQSDKNDLHTNSLKRFEPTRSFKSATYISTFVFL